MAKSRENPRPRTATPVVPLLMAGLFLLSVLITRVHAEEQTLRQMNHSMWTARDGAPQGVTALGQATDGTLWIGGQSGLFKFDGHKFNEFHSPPGEPQWPSRVVQSILAAKDGSVWTGMYQAGVGRIANGHVTLYPKADDQTLGQVQHLRQARDGSLWALANNARVIHFGADQAWHVEPSPASGRMGGVFVDSSNVLWVAQGGFLYRRQLPQSAYVRSSVPAEVVFGFSEAPDGSIWMADIAISGRGNRVQHFDHLGNVLEELPELRGGVRDILYLLDGSVLVSNADGGVMRFHPQIQGAPSGKPQKLADDLFSQPEGMSSIHSSALLMDSDKNIWVGNQRGLDRFRTARLTRFVAQKPEARWVICTNPKGEVWLQTVDQLYKVVGSTVTDLSYVADLGSIFCEDNGDVILNDHAEIRIVHDNHISTLPHIPQAIAFEVGQVIAAADHSLYAIVGRSREQPAGGIWHFKDNKWNRVEGNGVIGAPGFVEYIDSHQRLWIGQNEGRLVLPLEGAGQVLYSGQPGIGTTFAILDTSHGLFAAGTNGLAVFRADHFEMLNVADQASARGVRGLVESRNGDLWLNAIHGVVHLTAAELEEALAKPGYAMKSDLVAEGDFVMTSQVAGAPNTAARDAEGNLWFASLNGAFHFNPERRSEPSRPPILAIQSIAADQSPLPDNRKVGPRPQNLEIHYLGVNLTAPDSVIYRYQLDNLDTSWQDAGTRTVAIYPKLGPGTYTFRVMASNGDGVWTAPISAEPFTVLPSFYQSMMFKCLCASAGVIAVWLVIRLRVRTVARAIRARAEARADERIRISRDLHDTLLQGVQGLLLNFHVAAQKIAGDSESKSILDKALASADRIIVEGRNRVGSLRTEHLRDGELLGSLNNLAGELNFDSRIEFSIARTGTEATLKADVVDEVFSIGREALTNAFRHSQASKVRTQLVYGRRYFHLVSQDDGIGFDLGGSEKSGHWGLKGMAERAERIGGQLKCQSSPAAGTQIHLKIPAYRAYANRSRLQFYFDALRFSETDPAHS